MRLDKDKTTEPGIMQVILETICAIANVGPEADGFIYLGIADSVKDSDRVKTLYMIEPVKFDHVSIVGIEREAKHLGIELDQYMRQIEDGVGHSKLTDPLKTQVLSAIDVVDYNGLNVVRIRVPKQKQANFVGDDCFIRAGSSTHKATGPQIAAVIAAFASRA